MYDQSRLHRAVNAYLGSLAQGGLTEKYVREQRYLLRRFEEHCRAHGVRSPGRITPEVSREFVLKFDGMSVTWQKTVIVTVRGLLKFCKNPAAMDLKVKLTGTSRTKIRWLSEEQLRRTFDGVMKPSVAVMVHLGLLMGLRMCEILRIRQDEAQAAIRSGMLVVHSKGRTTRLVPLHPDARDVLTAYLTLDLPRRNPELLLGFGKSRAEDLLGQFQEDNEIEHYSFHDMRRTCALKWFEARDDQGRRMVEPEVISTLLGHRDPAQTKEYIGLNLYHLQQAMACYRVTRWRTAPDRPAK